MHHYRTTKKAITVREIAVHLMCSALEGGFELAPSYWNEMADVAIKAAEVIASYGEGEGWTVEHGPEGPWSALAPAKDQNP